MIYTHDITIPNRARWGGVVHSEFVAPSNMHHIRGLLCIVRMGLSSKLKRVSERVYNDVTHKTETHLLNSATSQVGSYSVSINNADVVIAGAPSLVVNELTNGSWGKNVLSFEPVTVPVGSVVRFAHEEMLVSPFVDDTDANYDLYPAPKGENAYTLRLLIDYD